MTEYALWSSKSGMRDINYNHLYYFHVVATEGSLVEASRKLGVAPSTISQQIRLLEASLGVQLFDRNGSGMRLTPAGKRALEQTQIMFTASERLEQAVRPSAVPDRVKLEVGVCASISRTFASRLFLPLFESNEVIVRLRHGEADELAHRLRSFEVDLLLTDVLPHRPQAKSMVVEYVKKVPLVAVAAPSLAQKLPNFPKETGDAPFVHYTTSASHRWAVDEYLRSNTMQPLLAAEVDDVELMTEIAAQGTCWCIVPQATAEQRLKDGTLAVLAELKEPYEAVVYAVYMDKDPSQYVLAAVKKLKGAA